MAESANLIVYPVSDLDNAKKMLTSLLGVEPYVDGPNYVGYKTDGQEIGLNPHGDSRGPIAYWETEDITAKLSELTSAGWETKAEPRDVGRGMLVASVTDKDGNEIGLRQPPRG